MPLLPKPSVRDLEDASRVGLMLALVTAAAAFTYEFSGIPPSAPAGSSLRTSFPRSITWVAVTVVVLSCNRLGETGSKCLGRLVGTVIGGAAGLAAALAHSAAAATVIAFVTGAVGELIGSPAGHSYAGKMVGVSYAVVAMPAFGAFGQSPSSAVQAAVTKLAVERLLTVVVGVTLVYLFSVAWFPRAASEDAFDCAEEAVARLKDMSAASFRSAAVMAGGPRPARSSGGGLARGGDATARSSEADLATGGDATARSSGADLAGSEAGAPPPCLPSPPGQCGPASKAAYLSRLKTRSLPLSDETGVRAAHLAELHATLQATALAQGKMRGALAVAQKEIVLGRLPVLACSSGGGGCVGGGSLRRRRQAATAAITDSPTSAAAGALPSPPLEPLPGDSSTVRRPLLTWRPVYLPTVGLASSAWIRRAFPATLARRALPSTELEDVGRATAAVSRALWICGDACGGGFPAYMSDLVKARYGPDLARTPAERAAERTEAAGVAAGLSALVTDCLDEALAGLRAARHTFVAGVIGGAEPRSDAATMRARWPALARLQQAQLAMMERRSSFDRAEEATLAGVELLHARARGGPAPPRLPPLPPSRLPNTLEASSLRIRWLALLFGLKECRHGLEELSASIEALRETCEAAAGVDGWGDDGGWCAP